MSLTDEDKTWITEQLRGYLREDRAWTTEQLRDTNSRITEYLREDRNRIMEEIRTVETSLLTEFHKWASPSRRASEPTRRRWGRLTWKWKRYRNESPN